MNIFHSGVVRAVTEVFDFPAPVVEIGSYQVEGQEAWANLRSSFPGKPYIGIDMRPGPGVDRVENVESLSLGDASAGAVIAMNTFEHVPHFWRGFDEIHRVLRPDGVFLLSTPFYFHIHNHPSDYWRFTPEALDLLLEKYPQRIMGWHGPKNRPASVWSVAFREAHPPITAAQFMRYRELLASYAREPVRWGRTLRYQFGRWLCGRGPFAPYLDQNRWSSELRGLRAA